MRALSEMLRDERDEEKSEHLFGLAEKIMEKEEPFSNWDSDADTGYLDEVDPEPFETD